MNETLLEMKDKLHTVDQADFKFWHESYREQARKNLKQGIDWPIEDMTLFYQISHLWLILKKVQHALLNSENFEPVFFEYFSQKRLSEMSQYARRVNETPENVSVNLH